jgi:hypothetical protein
MPLGTPPQDEQDLDAFIRPHVPGGDPARQPMRKLFEPGEDPRGWDRASLRLNTHPLHPRRRFSRSDFLLPRASSTVRVLGDGIVLGGSLALLAYFPLLLVSFMVEANISAWLYGTMATVFAAGAGLVLLAAWTDRSAEPY